MVRISGDASLKKGLRDDGVEPVIVWFRDDLRLADNPALKAAADTGHPLICIFVYQSDQSGVRPLGGAARWWLHGSLQALDKDLRVRGGKLWIFSGDAKHIIPRLVHDFKARIVFWNRRYDEAERLVDESIKSALKNTSTEAKSFNGHLLYEPWTTKSSSGGPFRIYSAFSRVARARQPDLPVSAPQRLIFFDRPDEVVDDTVELADLRLEPSSPDWAGGLRATWRRGEAGALSCLREFLERRLPVYADFRDRPDHQATSRLSPYLRFGNVSARQVWHAATAEGHAMHSAKTDRSAERFQSELLWREFSYHLLYYNPDIARRNLRPQFDKMPWRRDPRNLRAWQRGRTGYPLVDAGMRELWTTGWMHNRVRMVAASFLTKHLLIDWREGESWFWDTLVDADPANNGASWQWVAGSGADAAPYFRIFNPVLQGKKFDPEGVYVRRWLPELANAPASRSHRPREKAEAEPCASQIGSAAEYVERIVDHDNARRRALDAYKRLG